MRGLELRLVLEDGEADVDFIRGLDRRAWGRDIERTERASNRRGRTADL